MQGKLFEATLGVSGMRYVPGLDFNAEAKVLSIQNKLPATTRADRDALIANATTKCTACELRDIFARR